MTIKGYGSAATTDPDYFRAITLISCLGKLFTSIVNTRLIFFANEVTLIHENQAGFRKGYSTIRKTENKKGNTFSPCLTPVRQGKKSD
jgi:hypothetical protein